jgi:hypothetical protein
MAAGLVSSAAIINRAVTMTKIHGTPLSKNRANEANDMDSLRTAPPSRTSRAAPDVWGGALRRESRLGDNEILSNQHQEEQEKNRWKCHQDPEGFMRLPRLIPLPDIQRFRSGKEAVEYGPVPQCCTVCSDVLATAFLPLPCARRRESRAFCGGFPVMVAFCILKSLGRLPATQEPALSFHELLSLEPRAKTGRNAYPPADLLAWEAMPAVATTRLTEE